MSDSIGLGKHKSAMMDEVHSGAKATWISADNYVLDRSNLSTTVKRHDDVIQGLSSGQKALEQQVAAMARIIDAANLPKLQEKLKLDQDDWARSLKQNLDVTQKEWISRLENDFAEVTNLRSGLSNKMDVIESRLSEQFRIKVEEVHAKANDNKDTIEKLIASCDATAETAAATQKAMQSFDAKVQDMKKEVRTVESKLMSANHDQDRVVANLNADLRASLEAARTKLVEEGARLTKMIETREYQLVDEVANVKELLAKESVDRVDGDKATQNFLSDAVNRMKVETLQKVEKVEAALALKVKNFVVSVGDARRLIEEEAVHRETGDKELARRIAKEEKDRHHDEERMVGLISVMQGTLAKMHRNVG